MPWTAFQKVFSRQKVRFNVCLIREVAMVKLAGEVVNNLSQILAPLSLTLLKIIRHPRGAVGTIQCANVYELASLALENQADFPTGESSSLDVCSSHLTTVTSDELIFTF